MNWWIVAGVVLALFAYVTILQAIDEVCVKMGALDDRIEKVKHALLDLCDTLETEEAQRIARARKLVDHVLGEQKP